MYLLDWQITVECRCIRKPCKGSNESVFGTDVAHDDNSLALYGISPVSDDVLCVMSHSLFSFTSNPLFPSYPSLWNILLPLLCSLFLRPPSRTDASLTHEILELGAIAWRSTSNHSMLFPEESHCELHKQRCMWIKTLMLHYHCNRIIGTLIYILPTLSIYQGVMRYLTCCYSMYAHVLYITTCYLPA